MESELYQIFWPRNSYAPYVDIGFWLLLMLLYAARTVPQLLNGNAYHIVHGSYSFVLWLPLFITLVNLPSIRKAFGIRRIRSMLEAGIPLSHSADWQGKLRHKRWLTYFFGIMTAIFFFLSFFPNFLDYTGRPMAEIGHPVPFVSLSEIESDPDFLPLRAYEENGGERVSETVSFHASVGAPVQFSIDQRGIIKGKTNQKGKPYNAGLRLHYKKFSFLVSPQEYLEAYISHYRESYGSYLPKDGWTETVLADTPFDYALSLQKDDNIELYMILGDKMLTADYTGGQDLTQCYDLFLEVLQQEYRR